MKNFQRLSGIAALLHAAAYLTGIGLYATVLNPVLNAAPADYLAMLDNKGAVMYWWIFICYIVAGFCLVPVALSIHRRLSTEYPDLSLAAAVLAFIWAALIIGSGNLMMSGFSELQKVYSSDPLQAQTVLHTLNIVENGLISSNEFIGGVWAFLLSMIAIRTKSLNRIIAYSGLVIGSSGIISVFPPLNEIGSMLFGILMIPWFVLLGVHILRNPVRIRA